jgi:hypothetical protein
LTLEADLQLGSVGDFRFSESAIELIGIPALVEVLEGSAFSRARTRTITFNVI